MSNNRILLVTLWFGPTPDWMAQFYERIAANADLVDFLIVGDAPQGIRLPANASHLLMTRQEFNLLFYCKYGFRLGEKAGRAICDVRPAIGELFDGPIGDRDWWGWVDLDVVLGRFKSFTDPMLYYSLISTNPRTVNGPLTLLRRTESSLHREGDYRRAYAADGYENYDETGMTAALRSDERVWPASTKFLDAEDSDCRAGNAGCYFDDEGRLFSIRTGCEILAYHFSGAKRWPF